VIVVVIALVVASPLAAPALERVGIQLPIASRFIGFFFGYGVARLYYDAPGLWARLRPALRHAGWPAVIAVFLIRYQWMRTSEAARTTPAFEWTFYLCADACFALLVAHLLNGAGTLHRILCTRPAQYLGRVSYSFYLVHGLYGIPLAARMLDGLRGGVLFRMIIGYAAALALTTAMAGVLFHFFERPYFRSRMD
jgi:peptidoglycan/LPS O-acetylase OafA/YrhL